MLHPIVAIRPVDPIRPIPSLALVIAHIVYESPVGHRYSRNPSRARLARQMALRRRLAG